MINIEDKLRWLRIREAARMLNVSEPTVKFDNGVLLYRGARQSAPCMRLPHVMASFLGEPPCPSPQRRAAPLTPSLANKRGRQNGDPLKITLKIRKNELLEPPGDE